METEKENLNIPEYFKACVAQREMQKRVREEILTKPPLLIEMLETLNPPEIKETK